MIKVAMIIDSPTRKFRIVSGFNRVMAFKNIGKTVFEAELVDEATELLGTVVIDLDIDELINL